MAFLILGEFFGQLSIQQAEVIFVGEGLADAGLAVGRDDLGDAVADQFVVGLLGIS